MEPARLPSEEEFSIPPFATEDDYDRILSKDDLRKHLQKIGRMTETPKTPANIDRLMDDVLSQLKVIEHRMSDTNTPRTRIRSSENEIKAVSKLCSVSQKFENGQISFLFEPHQNEIL